MNIFRTSSLFAITLALAVACKRDEPAADPQPVSAAPPATSPANPVDATSAVDNTPAAADSSVDIKAIAGNFSDGESVLDLRADGSYVQTLNAGGASISSDGTWSGTGSKSLLLDPSSKSAKDVGFEVVSSDELRTDNGTRVFRRVAGR